MTTKRMARAVSASSKSVAPSGENRPHVECALRDLTAEGDPEQWALALAAEGWGLRLAGTGVLLQLRGRTVRRHLLRRWANEGHPPPDPLP